MRGIMAQKYNQNPSFIGLRIMQSMLVDLEVIEETCKLYGWTDICGHLSIGREQIRFKLNLESKTYKLEIPRYN
mgnify:CR=1 FL=1